MNAQFAYATPAQAQTLGKLEALRKQGHSFIRVFYRGRQSMPALHGYVTIDVVQEFDSARGKNEWRTTTGTSPIRFTNNGAGDMYADIYDCEHNRYALSRLIDFQSGDPPIQMIEIEDQKVFIELRKLANKEYNVEPDIKTQLIRKRALLDAEIASLDKTAGMVQEDEPEQIPEPIVEPEMRPAVVDTAPEPIQEINIAEAMSPPVIKRRGRPRRAPHTQNTGA